jgi:hypothetical protein
MAGQFVTILNPGYSTLYTRDLPFLPNTNVGGASLNPFNPDSSDPLQEGEWLQMSAGKFTRGAATDGAVAAAGSASALALINDANNIAADMPCFLYFQERGRYDAQFTRKAHCITGPSGFEFRTKQIVCASGDEGERVYVYICEDTTGRLVSALVSFSSADAASTAPAPTTGSWYAGTILQVHGTNDATVLFQPGYL